MQRLLVLEPWQPLHPQPYRGLQAGHLRLVLNEIFMPDADAWNCVSIRQFARRAEKKIPSANVRSQFFKVFQKACLDLIQLVLNL